MNVAKLQFFTSEKKQEPVKKGKQPDDFSDILASLHVVAEKKIDKVPENNTETDLDVSLPVNRKEISFVELPKELSLSEQTEIQEITSILDVTEEELNELLGMLGFTLNDLTNPECLTKLVLTVNESTSLSDALTNETLSSQLYELKMLFEQQKQEPVAEIINPVELSQAFDSVEDETKVMSEQLKNDWNETRKEQVEPKLEVTVEESKPSNEGQESFQQSDYDLNSFVSHLQQATTEMKTETFDSTIEMSTIVDQIVEQIKVKIGENKTSMELILTPEHLGKVNLMITSKDGVMTAQFLTETEVAKEALESQMQLLKQNFEEQGLKVNEVEVMVASSPFNHQSGGFQEEGFQQSSDKKKQGHRLKQETVMESIQMVEESESLLLDSSTMNITA